MADMIKVRSASDATIVVNSPATMLVKTWNKRGAFHLISKDTLLQSFYNSSLEYLIKKGMLIVEDKDFLIEVGLIEADAENTYIELTEAMMKKYLGIIPVFELEANLKKLSSHQISDLVNYAIAHSTEMKMDRIELLSKYSNKNILKAIELYKADQED